MTSSKTNQQCNQNVSSPFGKEKKKKVLTKTVSSHFVILKIEMKLGKTGVSKLLSMGLIWLLIRYYQAKWNLIFLFILWSVKMDTLHRTMSTFYLPNMHCSSLAFVVSITESQ